MTDNLDIKQQEKVFNFDELWAKYPQEKPSYPKLTANVIKAYLLEHYRFTHRIHMIATECCFADVFYIHETKTKKECTEIEIKISKQDLLNDFKKEKHQAYKNNKAYSNIQPDYF